VVVLGIKPYKGSLRTNVDHAITACVIQVWESVTTFTYYYPTPIMKIVGAEKGLPVRNHLIESRITSWKGRTYLGAEIKPHVPVHPCMFMFIRVRSL
jgi:hypothetical protein